MVEFRILRAEYKATSRFTTLDLWRPDFGLFRDLLGRIPRDMALERSPGELPDFQESAPPLTHTKVQEVRQGQREACKDEQKAPD